MSKSKTVGKQLMSFTLQQKHGLASKEADGIIMSLFDVIEKALLEGQSVSLLNIGSLKAKPKTAGLVRNAFGTEITTKRCVTVQFYTSKAFVDTFAKKGNGKSKLSSELDSFKESLSKK